jgi:hypothetical protein
VPYACSRGRVERLVLLDITPMKGHVRSATCLVRRVQVLEGISAHHVPLIGDWRLANVDQNAHRTSSLGRRVVVDVIIIAKTVMALDLSVARRVHLTSRWRLACVWSALVLSTTSPDQGPVARAMILVDLVRVRAQRVVLLVLIHFG